MHYKLLFLSLFILCFATAMKGQNAQSDSLIVFHIGLETFESEQQELFVELFNSRIRSNGFRVRTASPAEQERVTNCEDISCVRVVVPLNRNTVYLKWRSLAGTYLITGFAGRTGSRIDPIQFNEAAQNLDGMITIIPNLADRASDQFRGTTTATTSQPIQTTPSNNQQQADTERTDITLLRGGGLAIESNTTDLRSEQVVDAWKRRGGQITSNSYGAGLSYLYLEEDIDGGFYYIEGVGFNVNLGYEQLGLTPPTVRNGRLSNWSGFKYGIGADFSLFTVTSEFDVSGFTSYTESSQYQLNIPINLGYSFGIGGGEGLRWRGVVVAVNYAPSYQMVIPEEGESTGQFNATGFSLDLDFATLNSALDRQLKEPQNRLSFFILPPVEDLPLFISLNYKRVFY